MKNDHFLPALVYLLFCVFLALLGCAPPKVQMPESMPPSIKEYKRVTILASNPEMKNTGIYLKKGDA